MLTNFGNLPAAGQPVLFTKVANLPPVLPFIKEQCHKTVDFFQESSSPRAILNFVQIQKAFAAQGSLQTLLTPVAKRKTRSGAIGIIRSPGEDNP